MENTQLHIDGMNVPLAVARFARTLHDQRSPALVGQCSEMPAVTSNSLWHADGVELEFTSLAARNQCVAVLVAHDLLNQAAMPTPDELFKQAYQLLRNEIGHPDQGCGRFLALWHAHANIFHAAASVINHGGGNVFGILRPLGAAIGFLSDFMVDDLLEIAHAYYPKTINDMAAGIFPQTIEQALISRPARAWELYERVKGDASDPAGSLYWVALLALARAGQQSDVIEKALADLQHGDAHSSKRGLWLLARLLTSVSLTVALQATCIATLRQYLHHAETDIHQAVVWAIGHAAPQQLPLLRDLLVLAKSNDQAALRTVLNLLYLDDGAVKGSDCFAELVYALSRLDRHAGFSIGDFDHILAQLFAEPHTVALAESCLTTWIQNNGNGNLSARDLLESFTATFGEVVKQPVLLARIITNWLLADENQLAGAAGGLISFLWVRNFRQPVFSKNILDGLNELDLRFLARRILGYVWHEEPMLSLIFSMLETNDASARTFGLVHTLLVDQAGRDYLHATMAAITAKKEIAPSEWLPLLDFAHAKLMGMASAREALPRLDELRAPERVRRAIALLRARKNEKGRAKADEKSVFLNLVTKIPMKAGVGWFAVKDGVVSEPAKLHTISMQASLPFRSVFDPVNYDISRLELRLAMRGDA